MKGNMVVKALVRSGGNHQIRASQPASQQRATKDIYKSGYSWSPIRPKSKLFRLSRPNQIQLLLGLVHSRQ